MEDFLKKHKEILNLTAIARSCEIKGRMLSKVANGEPGRKLNDDHVRAVKKVLAELVEDFNTLTT